MELRDYVRFLQLYWRMIALAILLTTGLSLAYTYAMSPEPTYTAKTRLFVSASAARERDTTDELGKFAVQRVQSYVELVNGDEIPQRLVQRFGMQRLGLSKRPGQRALQIRRLDRQISASPYTATLILQINARDPSADRAQFLADAAAKEFVALVRELETPADKTQRSIRATVIDSAAKPTTAIGGPQPRRSLGLGLVLGSLIGFGIAVVRESLKPEDAE